MNPEDFIAWDPEKFKDWNCEEVPFEIPGWCRFYWKQATLHGMRLEGFNFESFEIAMMSGPDCKAFADSSSCVEKLIHGTALFDGVRHLYFGAEPQNQGYFYYPKWGTIEWIINRIKELEKQFCPRKPLPMTARYYPDPAWQQFLNHCEATAENPKKSKTQLNSAERYANVDWSQSANRIARQLGLSHTAVLIYGKRHGFIKEKSS